MTISINTTPDQDRGIAFVVDDLNTAARIEHDRLIAIENTKPKADRQPIADLVPITPEDYLQARVGEICDSYVAQMQVDQKKVIDRLNANDILLLVAINAKSEESQQKIREFASTVS